MSGKNKGSNKQPRTKGNVKPSSSEKAASFLVQKTGGLGAASGMFFGNDLSTAAVGSFSGKIGTYVPLDHDPDAIHIDADIRMQLRKLDKRDAVTKQKALFDLIQLIQPNSLESDLKINTGDTELNESQSKNKTDDEVLSALPYWPRIYARLAMDEDRKVRELSQRALYGFTNRAGRNIAPYLKQLLPPWIMSQCDIYEPAALEADRAFQNTFPPHKQNDAYLHCWTEIFTHIEDTLSSENLATASKIYSSTTEDAGETAESKYARTVVACLRTLAKLAVCLADKDAAIERLTCLLKDKTFWRHSKPNMAVINAAYYLLIGQICQLFPAVAQNCCVQFSELTLRHVDQDSPVVVALLWEALLSMLNHVEDVWRFVSFRKSFLPKLTKILENGGMGNARYIFPNMLPLFSKLPLTLTIPSEALVYVQMLKKMSEGLHKERVYVSSLDANAIVVAIMECSRYLISELLKQDVLDVVDEIVKDVVLPLFLEALSVPRSSTFSESVFLQACHLLNFLNKKSSSLFDMFICSLNKWIPDYAAERYFNASLLSFLLQFTESQKPEVSLKKNVAFVNEDNTLEIQQLTILSLEKELWKVELLKTIQVLLEKLIVDNNLQCLMPYICISSKLPPSNDGHDADRAQYQKIILHQCSSLLIDQNLRTQKVCQIIGLGIADILRQISDPGVEIANFFRSLSDEQAVLFMDKLFPWLVSSDGNVTVVSEQQMLQTIILTSLEIEIVKWAKLWIVEIFENVNHDFEEKLSSLLKILFGNKLSVGQVHFETLSRIRCVLVQCVVDSLTNLDVDSITTNTRDFLAENVYHFVCLQEHTSSAIKGWMPLVLNLAELYFDYLSKNSKSADLVPVEHLKESDDVVYVYEKVDTLIGDVYEYLLNCEDQQTALMEFTKKFWFVSLNFAAKCGRKDGLDQLKKANSRFLKLSLQTQAENNLHFSIVADLCFVFVDDLLSALLTKIDQNYKYFHALLYHSNNQEFVKVLQILYYLLIFVDNSSFKINECIADYWLPYILTVSLVDSSTDQVDILGINQIIDVLRRYISTTNFQQLQLYPKLLDLSNGDFSTIADRKMARINSLPSFRTSLLYCIPSQPVCWPKYLKHHIDEMLTKWALCSSEEFCTIRDVLIPTAINGRMLVKEAMISSLTSTIDEVVVDDQNLPVEQLSRILSLIYSLVQADCSYLFSVMPLVMDLKDKHNFLVESDDSNSEMQIKLQPTLWTLWILFKGVQRSPGDITSEQLDFILCLTSTLTTVVVAELDQSIDSNLDLASFAYHVFCLIYAVGTALPCLQMDSVLTEWNDFFSVHIFGSLLPMFLDFCEISSNLGSDPETNKRLQFSSGFVYEALGSAVSVCPKERLLKHTLPHKLFADDPVLLSPVELQSLVNTLFPLLYHPRQSIQLAVLHLLLALSNQIALSLSSKSLAEADIDDESQFQLPLTITRNLYFEPILSLINKVIDSTAFGFVSSVAKKCSSTDLESCDDHKNLIGYLLTWRVTLSIFDASTVEIRGKFAAWLMNRQYNLITSINRLTNATFNHLMELLFRIMPCNPVSSLRSSGGNISSLSHPKTMVNLAEENPALYDRICDHRSYFQLQHLACNMFRRVLQDAPALARTWWLRQNKIVATSVERYTERFLTPLLCLQQIEEVNKFAASKPSTGPFPEDNELKVKGRPAARDVQATYRMQDSHAIEMIVSLPANYPLGQVSVESGKKVGVTTQQWRAWLLQLTIFLQNQNGSILEGLQIWKRNLDKRFEGVDECTICYSILHGSTFQLPSMQCRVCHKRFHRECMFKWFTTSQNPTCPLCRNLFYDVPHSWKQRLLQRQMETAAMEDQDVVHFENVDPNDVFDYD